MICAHCSTPVADEARFCHSCGSLVSDAEGQAAATAAMDQSSFLHMERMLREDTKGVYTIKHMLGRGGMAVVYLAEEAGLARKVALKVLPPELTFGHGVERFKREARTAAALDHPNIIPIYRIGDTGKLFWYAMKFLEGKSLEDLLRERGSLSLDESIEILEQVADALDYAHDHKVIHRDIKPANVMLDNRNRVIVTDFGIAKALSEGKLTATDSVIGTPYFMSPEQGMGKTVSGASDQYSVAVMAYRMLAGHVPFDGESAIDILHKHCMFPAPTLAEDAPHLPEHVSNAVARALSKTGDERFMTVHDFVQSMKDADFQAKEPARPSGATVVMTPADAKKLRTAGTKSGGSNPAGANSGKGRTVSGKQSSAASNDKTVLASSKAAAPAPAPAPKSKMPLVIGAVAVLAIGGFSALKFGPWAKAPEAPLTQTPPNAPLTNGPAATPDAGATGNPTLTPNAGAPTDSNPASSTAAAPPAANPAPAATKAETKTTPRTNTAANQTKSAPRQQSTPTNTQSQPANNPAPAPVQQTPAPAPAAAETGRFRLALNMPANIKIDGNDQGERQTFSGQLALGDHVLVVSKPGYETITRAVTIKTGTDEVLRLTLVPIP